MFPVRSKQQLKLKVPNALSLWSTDQPPSRERGGGVGVPDTLGISPSQSPTTHIRSSKDVGMEFRQHIPSQHSYKRCKH